MARKFVTIIAAILILVSGAVVGYVKSQPALKDFSLNGEQTKVLVELDEQIDKSQRDLNLAIYSKNQNLTAFAVSLGIKKEDFPKYRLEKKSDVYHILEMTPEEQAKAKAEIEAQRATLPAEK